MYNNLLQVGKIGALRRLKFRRLYRIRDDKNQIHLHYNSIYTKHKSHLRANELKGDYDVYLT